MGTKTQKQPDGSTCDVVVIGGNDVSQPTANFTRPADTTAYASGDLVANNVTAGSVTPMSFAAGINGFSVRRAKLKKSNTSLTNASFRLHLYSTLPTVTNGDNGAWLSIEAGYLGFIDITVDKAFSDGAAGFGASTNEINMQNRLGATIYGLLEARAAYTPASAEVFTVTLEAK